MTESMTLQFENRIEKHPSDADAWIDSTEFGRLIFKSDVQFRNASSSIDRIDSGKTTLLRRQQFSIVSMGMRGIGAWINTSPRDPQLMKALLSSVGSEDSRPIFYIDYQL